MTNANESVRSARTNRDYIDELVRFDEPIGSMSLWVQLPPWVQWPHWVQPTFGSNKPIM